MSPVESAVSKLSAFTLSTYAQFQRIPPIATQLADVTSPRAM